MRDRKDHRKASQGLRLDRPYPSTIELQEMSEEKSDLMGLLRRLLYADEVRSTRAAVVIGDRLCVSAAVTPVGPRQTGWMMAPPAPVTRRCLARSRPLSLGSTISIERMIDVRVADPEQLTSTATTFSPRFLSVLKFRQHPIYFNRRIVPPPSTSLQYPHQTFKDNIHGSKGRRLSWGNRG